MEAFGESKIAESIPKAINAQQGERWHYALSYSNVTLAIIYSVESRTGTSGIA